MKDQRIRFLSGNFKDDCCDGAAEVEEHCKELDLLAGVAEFGYDGGTV